MKALVTLLMVLWSWAANAFRPCNVPTSRPALPKDANFRQRTNIASAYSETVAAPDALSAGNDHGKALRQVVVLVCPAQFCVPADYEILKDQLTMTSANDTLTSSLFGENIQILDVVVPPLPRTEWIKVAKKLPTQEFVKGQLAIHDTLDWYFQAMEKVLADIFAKYNKNNNDIELCMVGHSIGGWVARAYLGNLSRSATAVHAQTQRQCKRLITLGTPHVCPDTAIVDQTRGLLAEIAAAPSCSSQALADRGIDVTCVISDSFSGNIFSTNVEELVAAASYFPLLGKWGRDVKGDGIVPLELAFMEAPARQLILDVNDNIPIRHAHVLPTPWNLWNGYAASWSLPSEGGASYVSSRQVIAQWAKYIE